MTNVSSWTPCWLLWLQQLLQAAHLPVPWVWLRSRLTMWLHVRIVLQTVMSVCRIWPVSGAVQAMFWILLLGVQPVLRHVPMDTRPMGTSVWLVRRIVRFVMLLVGAWRVTTASLYTNQTIASPTSFVPPTSTKISTTNAPNVQALA